MKKFKSVLRSLLACITCFHLNKNAVDTNLEEKKEYF